MGFPLLRFLHIFSFLITAHSLNRCLENGDLLDQPLNDPRLLRREELIPDLVEAGHGHCDFPLVESRVESRVEPSGMTVDGRKKIATVEYPRGHFRNPMTDKEVDAKFIDLATRVLSRRQSNKLLSLLWNLDGQDNLDAIFKATRIRRRSENALA